MTKYQTNNRKLLNTMEMVGIRDNDYRKMFETPSGIDQIHSTKYLGNKKQEMTTRNLQKVALNYRSKHTNKSTNDNKCVL